MLLYQLHLLCKTFIHTIQSANNQSNRNTSHDMRYYSTCMCKGPISPYNHGGYRRTPIIQASCHEAHISTCQRAHTRIRYEVRRKLSPDGGHCCCKREMSSMIGIISSSSQPRACHPRKPRPASGGPPTGDSWRTFYMNTTVCQSHIITWLELTGTSQYSTRIEFWFQGNGM